MWMNGLEKKSLESRTLIAKDQNRDNYVLKFFTYKDYITLEMTRHSAWVVTKYPYQ